MPQQVTAETLYFPALLFQVLAIAVQFVVPGTNVELALKSMRNVTLEYISQMLSQRGEDVMNILGRHTPALAAVQADIIRCAWLKNSGRGAESWSSLANAIR